jgi:hypothetical protein
VISGQRAAMERARRVPEVAFGAGPGA